MQQSVSKGMEENRMEMKRVFEGLRGAGRGGLGVAAVRRRLPRRILVCLLVTALCITLFPNAAFAE
jgi:hypothetical protein